MAERTIAKIQAWARKSQHWNPIVRAWARKRARMMVRGLRRDAASEDLTLFVAFLSFPEPHICGQAARALGKMGGAEAASIVREHLQGGASPNPAMLAWALGRMRDRLAVPILCDLARLRLPEAIRALGLIGDPAAVPILIELLETIESEQTGTLPTQELLCALGRLQDAQALPIVEQYFERHARQAPFWVLEVLFWVLGELGDETTLRRLEAPEKVDAFPERLVDLARHRLRNRFPARRRKARETG